MDREFPIPELAERERNFFNGAAPSTIEGKLYYANLENLAMSIEADIQKLRGISPIQMLKGLIFSRVYNFVIAQNDDYSIFDNNMVIYDDTFDACFFISLCMFLYDTKRIEGMSLRKFIYEHSPMEYNRKGSPNYFDFNFKYKGNDAYYSVRSEDTKLRQYKSRLQRERHIYHVNAEWHTMRKVSEHEWALYYALDEAHPEAQDAAKKIWLLSVEMNAALKSPMDSEYMGRLETAFDQFLSKLEKIKYERFLALCKFCLGHVNKDKTYCGINLYRFEKGLKLYAITGEVNRLLKCKTEDEENDILKKSIILKDLPFPKLYEYFSNLVDIRQTTTYAHTFWRFVDKLVRSSRLVIDKFVGEGFFGEDWEKFFLETTNEIAESVLYDPEKIDYSVMPRSQEMFMKVIAAPTKDRVVHMAELLRYMSFSPSDSEDDL